MTTNPTSPRNKRTPSVILLLAALGALLLILTTGLLAVRLQPMTGVDMTAAGGIGTGGSSAGDSGITLLSSTSPLSSRHITVSDAAGNAWTLTTNTIDLFQSSYQNENRQVTVQSSDGKKVIAPGTSGSYTFYVKNTGTTLLEYKLWLEKAFQVTADSGESAELPVQVRLSSGTSEYRTWLLGSSDTVWVNADTLKKIETDEEAAGTDIPQDAIAGALRAAESISYTLEWQWPFETGADENDVLLGNSDNAELTLQLNLIAEAEEPQGGNPVTPEDTETETTEPDNTEDGGSTETETTESETTETETPPGSETPDDETPDDTITRDNPNQGDTNTNNNPTPDNGTTNDNNNTNPTPDGNTPVPDNTVTDDNPTPDDIIVDDEPTPTSGGDDEPTPDYTTVEDEPTPLASGSDDTGHHFPWGWLLGLIFLILIILWRRITITGYLQDENGGYMEGFVLRLEQRRFHKTKEAEVDEDGYFKIRRIPLGKKTLILKDKDGNEIARNELRLKRKGKLRIDDFLEIEEKKEENEEKVYTEIDMRYRITGFEIYLHQRSTSDRIEIETDRWIAHTWFGKKYEPEEDKNEK